MSTRERTITGQASWRTARELDVTGLPEVVFGHRAIAWWGTVAFMVIEGTTLLVSIATYFYLRRNFDAWPPPPTPSPDLAIPTINLIVLLAMMVPMAIVHHAAKQFDRARVQRWLGVALLLGVTVVVLRIFEFDALDTRWDSHAYGSVVWVLVGLHSTLLGVDIAESIGFLLVMRSADLKPQHFSDVEDASLYQYFLSLSWVPVYLVVFLGPRLL